MNQKQKIEKKKSKTQPEILLDLTGYNQLLKRYTPDQIKDIAVNMVMKQGMSINQASLYSVLSALESDLEGMFS